MQVYGLHRFFVHTTICYVLLYNRFALLSFEISYQVVHFKNKMLQKASSQSDDTEGISYQREETNQNKATGAEKAEGGSPTRQRDDASSEDFIVWG